MKKLVFRRLAAYSIDYIIIATYALLIFGITTIMNSKELSFKPFSGQLVGFFSLTLPVFFYFFLMEKGRNRATIGKRIMSLCVSSKTEDAEPRILLRNILKFLPWEIAHTGVHWIVFYSKSQKDVPIWVWFVLTLPQVIIIVYLVSIIMSKGESGIYDSISNTKIKINQRTTKHIANGRGMSAG